MGRSQPEASASGSVSLANAAGGDEFNRPLARGAGEESWDEDDEECGSDEDGSDDSPEAGGLEGLVGDTLVDGEAWWLSSSNAEVAEFGVGFEQFTGGVGIDFFVAGGDFLGE